MATSRTLIVKVKAPLECLQAIIGLHTLVLPADCRAARNTLILRNITVAIQTYPCTRQRKGGRCHAIHPEVLSGARLHAVVAVLLGEQACENVRVSQVFCLGRKTLPYRNIYNSPDRRPSSCSGARGTLMHREGAGMGHLIDLSVAR